MSDDNRILDAEEVVSVRDLIGKVWTSGEQARALIVDLCDSHEALRAALEAEKKLLAEVTEHARLNELAAGAALATAEAERDYLREREQHFADVLCIPDGGRYRNDWTARLDRALAAEARVGALEAALRWALDALANDWELGEQYRAARAVLAVPEA